MSNTSQIKADATFRRVPFPSERKLVIDTLRLGRDKPMMHGFLELDVTIARQILRKYKDQTGEAISFTAFMLACLGKAVAAHPEVQALRDWAGNFVIFDDVDASTIIEIDVEGRSFPFAHVVRQINRRSLREIHEEIRSVKASGMDSLPGGLQNGARFFLMLPGFIRRLVYRMLFLSPQFAKKHTGTILVTSVGMFGAGSGWGMSAPGIHDFSVIIGGISKRLHAEPGAGFPSEILHLMISVNHEIVDGAPLARFVKDLTELIESAQCLEEFSQGSATDK